MTAYLVELIVILAVEDCLTVSTLLGLERITEETLHAGTEGRVRN